MKPVRHWDEHAHVGPKSGPIVIAVCVGIIAAVAVSLLLRSLGMPSTLVVLFLASAALFPRTLISFTDEKHVGISGAMPSISTYLLVVGAGAGLVVLAGYGRFVIPWLPFIVWLVVGMCFLWTPTPEHWAGIFQLLLAPCAWTIGTYVGFRSGADRKVRRTIVFVAAIIIFSQLIVALLQSSGLQINPMEIAQQHLLSGRFNGTLGHPNDLGKVVLFLLIPLLPLIRGSRGLLRNILFATFSAAFLVLALTGGRAVAIGGLVAVVLWILTTPREQGVRSRKAVVFLATLAATLMLSGVLVARFDEDPTGGARNSLVDLAWNQIGLRTFAGTGPNAYVSVVGQYDALTATGVPVHNSILLAIAELGVLGAATLILPFVLAAITALRVSKNLTVAGSYGRAILVFIPGLYLVATTGWGLLGSYVLPMLAYTFGLLGAGATPRYYPSASGSTTSLRRKPAVRLAFIFGGSVAPSQK